MFSIFSLLPLFLTQMTLHTAEHRAVDSTPEGLWVMDAGRSSGGRSASSWEENEQSATDAIGFSGQVRSKAGGCHCLRCFNSAGAAALLLEREKRETDHQEQEALTLSLSLFYYCCRRPTS